MTMLTNCPHCGKPLVQSAMDLQPDAGAAAADRRHANP
jgi:hypothetical protein